MDTMLKLLGAEWIDETATRTREIAQQWSRKNGFEEEIISGSEAYMTIFKLHVIYQDVSTMVERADRFKDLTGLPYK
ncbi:hypothetical protein F2Q70_00002795 [Brassica cretica]|uniref:Uncharacterized protein n=1 Tax=Brassica cretica TaxID=69181 RepID=A0A8S9IM77_BRACR|nr:hypothetical protein F2Q70_00002795 [Brassica cretica]